MVFGKQAEFSLDKLGKKWSQGRRIGINKKLIYKLTEKKLSFLFLSNRAFHNYFILLLLLIMKLNII